MRVKCKVQSWRIDPTSGHDFGPKLTADLQGADGLDVRIWAEGERIEDLARILTSKEVWLEIASGEEPLATDETRGTVTLAGDELVALWMDLLDE